MATITVIGGVTSRLLSNHSPLRDSKPLPTTRNCYISDEEKYINKTALNIKGQKQVIDAKESTKYKILKRELYVDDLIKDVSGEIESYAFSNTGDKVVLLIKYGSWEVGNEYKTVYVYDFNEEKALKVYELKSTPVDSTGYSIQIWSVNFSPDSSLLAITTSTGVMVYDFTNSVIKQLFSISNKEPDVRDIYAIVDPYFSPHNRYLLYRVGYYEGGASFVYDLQKRVVIDPHFQSYWSGDAALGWYGNRLIIKRFIDKSVEEHKDLKNGIFLVDPSNLNNLELVLEDTATFYSPEMNMMNVEALVNDQVYYSVVSSEMSGKYSCNNVNNKLEVESRIRKLYSIDLKTKKITEILSVDETNFSGVEEPPFYATYKKHHVDGNDRLIVLTSKTGDQKPDQIYILNDDNSLSRLVF